jgi:hypothetical protein
MILADLNIYSTFSDGKLSIPRIVDLYGSRGFGAIAITDHLCETNTLLGKAHVYMNRTLLPAVFPLYMEILKSEAKRAWKQYRMVLIPGVDLTKNSVISHRSAHVLGLGVTRYVSADGDVAEIARAVRGQGGVAIAGKTPHLWDRRIELASEFDAWEAAHGKSLSGHILASGLPTIASSGMHVRGGLASWKTVLFCERDQNAVLDAIRKQNLCFKYYGDNSDAVHFGSDLVAGGRLHRRIEPLHNVVMPQTLPLRLDLQDQELEVTSGIHS